MIAAGAAIWACQTAHDSLDRVCCGELLLRHGSKPQPEVPARGLLGPLLAIAGIADESSRPFVNGFGRLRPRGRDRRGAVGSMFCFRRYSFAGSYVLFRPTRRPYCRPNAEHTRPPESRDRVDVQPNTSGQPMRLTSKWVNWPAPASTPTRQAGRAIAVGDRAFAEHLTKSAVERDPARQRAKASWLA